MVFPAIVAGLGGLAGGIVSGIFGSQAAEEQAEAAGLQAQAGLQATELAIGEQARQFDVGLEELRRQQELARADIAPFREAGVTALGLVTHGTLPGREFNAPFYEFNLTTDPGFQFRLDEGLRALTRQQAAAGRLHGGRGMREAVRFGQELASQEYTNAFNRHQIDLQNRFNRLAFPTGLGQTSATQLAGIGTQTGRDIATLAATQGTNIGNLLQAQGAIRGTSYANQGNIAASRLANIGSSINQGIGGVISAANLANQQAFYNRLLG